MKYSSGTRRRVTWCFVPDVVRQRGGLVTSGTKHLTTQRRVDRVWNVMAHAQKPDFVFRRNGRVHLSRRGRHFSRLLAAEVFSSAVVMLDTPGSEVVWRVLATHSIRQFPLHFPSRASPCAITFQLDTTTVTGVTGNVFHSNGSVLPQNISFFDPYFVRISCYVPHSTFDGMYEPVSSSPSQYTTLNAACFRAVCVIGCEEGCRVDWGLLDPVLRLQTYKASLVKHRRGIWRA